MSPSEPERILALDIAIMSSNSLSPYKAEFMKAAIGGGALKFGCFTLKSGRLSPYFFNAGDFYRADLLRAISTAFAKRVIETANEKSPLEFDVVFGPAYKGIPLATATTDKLAELDPKTYSRICYSFDRKELKDHGEGGGIVGAPLKGKRVLIVDDVVSAGTAKREAIGKIQKEGGIVAGIVVALDRMERLNENENKSAIGEIRREYGIPVIAILTLDDIMGGLKEFGSEDDIRRLEEYRTKYKATD